MAGRYGVRQRLGLLRALAVYGPQVIALSITLARARRFGILLRCIEAASMDSNVGLLVLSL